MSVSEQLDMFGGLPVPVGATWRDLFVGPSTAIFSPCGTYRRALSRDCTPSVVVNSPGGIVSWTDHTTAGVLPPLVGIGLNPSTADHRNNDQTILKDIKFTKAWGFGRFIKLNAYDYKATKPNEMFAAQKRGVPINTDDNNRMILHVVNHALECGGKIWVAWGTKIERARQLQLAQDLLGDVELWCIDINNDLTPVHELYQPDASVLQRWPRP